MAEVSKVSYVNVILEYFKLVIYVSTKADSINSRIFCFGNIEKPSTLLTVKRKYIFVCELDEHIIVFNVI